MAADFQFMNQSMKPNSSGGGGQDFGFQDFNYSPTVRPTQNYGFGNTQQGLGSSTYQPPDPFGAGGFLGGLNLSPSSFQTKNEPVSRYLENFGFPAAQLQQNAAQYWDQSQRQTGQWLAQYEWGRQQDQFNMALAQAQQNAAVAQARQQASQFNRQFTQQQLNDLRQYELATGDLSLRQRIASSGTWEQQQAAALGRQQFGLQQQIAGQGTWEQQQAAAFARQQLAQEGSQFNRQFGLQQRIANRGTWEQQQAARLAQAELAMQQRFGSRGTWEQQQAARLGQQQFGLAQMTQRQQAAYQQQQLAQQRELELAQMAAQERMASMSAFGRYQAPQGRFVASWA